MPRESKADRKKRTAKIIRKLRKACPNATTELNWSNPLELLVATILSAQCTDARVNIVTKEVFARYRRAADYAAAKQETLETEIRTAGFFRNKARSIRGAAARIVEDFGGKVPETMEEMLSLPGVARKTASVVLGTAYGVEEGIAVDTHVTRVSGRLRLTRHKTNQSDRIEKDLMELVPRRDFSVFSHMIVLLGRYTCSARKPNCADCPVSDLCPSAFKA